MEYIFNVFNTIFAELDPHTVATDVRLSLEVMTTALVTIIVALIGWMLYIRSSDSKKLDVLREYCDSTYMKKETVEANLSLIMETLKVLNKQVEEVKTISLKAVEQSQNNANEIAYIRGLREAALKAEVSNSPNKE